MDWLYYLLEANLYLVLFYGFYRLFLQNETFYNLNRYFLLLSTLISFGLPILQLGFLKLPPTENPNLVQNVYTTPEGTELNWIYVIYIFIAFGFAVKLIYNIYKIVKIWINAKKYTAGDVTLIEVNDEATAFSFFNLLFIHPSLTTQPTVLKHEMVHIQQKHSFDIVFLELVQIMCWFNPILHFVKRDLKLLHEYIADDLTTSSDVQKHEYALFLIQNSFGLRTKTITNQIFNQSILKRRINMLNKKRTAGWARLRLLLVLPLTGSMLCVSTMAFTKDYGYVDLLPEKSEFIAPIQEKLRVDTVKKSSKSKQKTLKKQDQVKFPPPIVKRDKEKIAPPPPVEPGVAKKDQVKFPPPIVKPDKPRKKSNVPPPPVEPRAPKKKTGVKTLLAPPPPVEPPTKILNLKLKEENPTSLKLKEEIKVQLKQAQKAIIKSPKPTIKKDIAVLNKVKGYLEERLEETQKENETTMHIQKQLAFIQSKIAKKSTLN